jgi:hypothetical protein
VETHLLKRQSLAHVHELLATSGHWSSQRAADYLTRATQRRLWRNIALTVSYISYYYPAAFQNFPFTSYNKLMSLLVEWSNRHDAATASRDIVLCMLRVRGVWMGALYQGLMACVALADVDGMHAILGGMAKNGMKITRKVHEYRIDVYSRVGASAWNLPTWCLALVQFNAVPGFGIEIFSNRSANMHGWYSKKSSLDL